MATTIPKEAFLQYKRKTKKKMIRILLPILFFLFCFTCFGGYQFYQLNQRVKKLEKMIQKHGTGLSEEVHSHSLRFINNEVAELSYAVKILQKQHKEMENEVERQSQMMLSEFNKRLKEVKDRSDEEKQQLFSAMNKSLQVTRNEVKQMLLAHNSTDLDHGKMAKEVVQAMEGRFSRINDTLGAIITDRFKQIKEDQIKQFLGSQRVFESNINLLLDMIDNLNNTRLGKTEEPERRNQTNWNLGEDVRMLKEARDSCVKVENFHATEAYLEGKIEEVSRQVRELKSLFKEKASLVGSDDSIVTFLNEFGRIINSLRQ